MKKIKVAIVMGSDSDLRVMNDAAKTLTDFSVPYSIKIVSAHRTPHDMLEFAKTAKDEGLEVIIAGAGGAAHLPGMIASATTLPVIGVPVQLKHLEGLDSLLSIVQMPRGVPVATMAIDNSTNAALLALRILALNDKGIAKKLLQFQKEMKSKVKTANKNLKSSSPRRK